MAEPKKAASKVHETFMRNRKERLKSTSGPRRRISAEKMRGQVNKFSVGDVYKDKKNPGAVHQDGRKFGGDEKTTSRAAADFGWNSCGPKRPHHRHAVSSPGMERNSAPSRRELLLIAPAGRVATLKAQFEDVVQGMSENSRRWLENDTGMREMQQAAWQQRQCSGKEMGQESTPVPKPRKTPGVLKIPLGTGGPSTQVQETIQNAGQVEMEAAGIAQRTDPELDGVYETMKKVTPQADDGDYVEMMGPLSAVAMYSYQAEKEDQLSFKANDIIAHIERVSATWWRGRCRERVGLFPICFVQPIW